MGIIEELVLGALSKILLETYLEIVNADLVDVVSGCAFVIFGDWSRNLLLFLAPLRKAIAADILFRNLLEIRMGCLTGCAGL